MTTKKLINRLAMIKRLKKDDEGIALVEFAFSLPILLALIFGALETANYALAHLRVSQIAMTVADNAGRVDTAIDEANIYEVFAGAALVGESLDFNANGRIVLSSLQPNNLSGSDEGQMINWQRCMGQLTSVTPAYGVEDDGRTDDSLENGMGPAGNRITATTGTAVMFVEVTYNYRPLIPNLGMLGTRQIRYESAFNVRDRTNQDISNTQGLTVNGC
ncbi:MAG: TadE/TadG family type IV pilus assembly protein [Pseudomonadota bacterium]